MIEFQLDPASGVATYLQLAQQVRDALRLGLLEPGDRLPTAQQVVAKLVINPNTVLKACRELDVIEESHAGKQITLLVRTSDPVLDPAWTVRPVSLEDLVLAYMSQPGDAARADLAGLEIAS